MMSQNKTTSNQIPLYRKFNLTITEAAQYFNIGEKEPAEDNFRQSYGRLYPHGREQSFVETRTL